MLAIEEAAITGKIEQNEELTPTFVSFENFLRHNRTFAFKSLLFVVFCSKTIHGN
jgi:hypothetical protein